MILEHTSLTGKKQEFGAQMPLTMDKHFEIIQLPNLRLTSLQE